jgi:pimeloyl-ACP methyl ester carboxylesterase
MLIDVHGHRAYAYTGGRPFDPALPCLVFVHGALNDHSVWTLAARWFAHHGWSVLAVDQPGHCRSRGPVKASVGEIADWTLALLDAVGAPRAAFVGHSMGSLIALECAARAPQRASHLVMVGTAYPMKVSDALLSGARERPEATIHMVNTFSHSTLAAKPSYPGPGTWLHGAGAALMRHVLASNTEVNLFEHDFRLCDAYANGLEAAAAVTCPATLLLGAADQMTPPKATKDIAAALRAKTVVLPGGHAVMQENPEGVLEALRSALR